MEELGLELLTKYGLVPRRIEVLDSSMLGDFVDCPSMFYLKHILGLRPSGSDVESNKIALDWGSTWHTGMYAYYADYEGSMANLQAGLEAINECYPAYINPVNDPKTKRSKDRMLKQLVAYHNKYRIINLECEIIRREQFFDVEHEGFRWCGRMDSIRRKLSPSKIQVWDYKTTSAMGDRYFDKHELSFQFPGYVWAANQMISGEEILELQMDVMYTLSASFDFFRRPFRYDSYRRAEFVHNTTLWIEQIMEMQDRYLYQPEMWRKNYNECTRYHTCMFFPVHNVHPKGDTRLRLLGGNYIEDRWDPSAIGE